MDVSSQPPRYVCYVLGEAELVSVSWGALQALKVGSNAKYVPKEPVMHLYEKITGQKPDELVRRI